MKSPGEKFKSVLLLVLSAAVFISSLTGCTTQPAASTSETISAPANASFSIPEGYTLSRVVVLSRHNIRSPLSGTGSTLGKMTPHQWTDWSAPTGELTFRGGLQETAMGQYFRQYLAEQGFMEENWQPDAEEVRFYANSMQRTIATAQYFSSGFLPVSNQKIEHHYDVGTMDPVFTPQLTFVDDDYRAQALQEIAAMGGENGMAGITASLQENYRLLEQVLDLKNSEYAREQGITQFPEDEPEFSLELNKEPSVKGSLKTATSASDALILQYFEEPDDTKAAFGQALTWDQWCALAHIVDTYTTVLFTAPSVSINVAHPLLMELENELTAEGRKFSFLCGHDSNVASVLAALGVKDHVLPESVSQQTPIGCKLVFECWIGPDSADYATVSLVYQSASQLRGCEMLSLESPPQKVKLAFEGLAENPDGLYPLEALLERFDEAIDAYEQLTGTTLEKAA
ncbi:MAG: histidine-type phosphatase [Faecalibacterium sp.]